MGYVLGAKTFWDVIISTINFPVTYCEQNHRSGRSSRAYIYLYLSLCGHEKVEAKVMLSSNGL